jgi:hypothetical protein
VTVDKFEEDGELEIADKETQVVAAISAIEPEWQNSPIENFDHLLDESLQEEQREQLK